MGALPGGMEEGLSDQEVSSWPLRDKKNLVEFLDPR